MPSEPLFDWQNIDLSRTAISAEEVAAYNPQSGPMRQLDRVIWHNEDQTQFVGIKQVRDDEFWIPHHIPGRPLMPGVLMIEAAAQLASVAFQCRIDQNGFLGFTRCDDVIFRHQVVPGDTLYLLSRDVKFSKRRLVSQTQGWVNGTMAFEALITGMAF